MQDYPCWRVNGGRVLEHFLKLFRNGFYSLRASVTWMAGELNFVSFHNCKRMAGEAQAVVCIGTAVPCLNPKSKSSLGFKVSVCLGVGSLGLGIWSLVFRVCVLRGLVLAHGWLIVALVWPHVSR